MSTDGTVNVWLNALQEQFKAADKIPAVVDPKTFYDAALYAETPAV